LESSRNLSQHIQDLEVQLNSVTDPRLRIDILNELAWVIHLNDQEKARSLVEQSYQLASSGKFEQMPYLAGLAGSLRSQAALNNDAGNYDLALSQSLRALEILEGLADDGSETNLMLLDVLGNISWTYRSFGDYGVAAEYAMKALKRAQALGDSQHEFGMLNILSVIYAESNDLNAALEIGQKVVQHCRLVGHVRGESIALNNLALTYLELGSGAQALEACRKSLDLAREHGIDRVALTALSTMGEVYLGIKDFVNAEDYLLQALGLARQHKAGSDEFECLLNLGKVYQSRQNDQAALSAIQSALAISRASNDRRGEFQCHELLAEIYEKRNEFTAALQHFKEFHTLKETVFNENSAKRLAGLQVSHQVETAKRDAEIHYLKTVELKQEIDERKRTQVILEKLASLDSLTGLLNRREFFLLGEREFQVAQESGRPLTAILLDLDHFKQINDAHGHVAGDEVLIHTTEMLRESLRLGEIIGRYGGDEFIILLPGSNCDQGQQVAGRLCEKMASRTIATSKGDLSLTLSLGVVGLRESQSTSLEMLFDLADQALYAAKRAGGNQLAVYDSSHSQDPTRPI
jgi:diguanylate cyclase (GGDEF)-like protein